MWNGGRGGGGGEGEGGGGGVQISNVESMLSVAQWVWMASLRQKELYWYHKLKLVSAIFVKILFLANYEK